MIAGKKDLLANVPLFSACTKNELSKIASLADRVNAKAGDVLTQQGKPGREFFVIEDGKANVTLNGRKLATLGAGDFFGEMALLDQGPRSATVTAQGPMTLYVIGAREFSKLIEDVPFVAKKMLKGMANRIRTLENAPKYEWNRL